MKIYLAGNNIMGNKERERGYIQMKINASFIKDYSLSSRSNQEDLLTDNGNG